MFLSGRPRHPKTDVYKWFPETSESSLFSGGRPRHPKADAYKWFPETSEGGCFISGPPEAFPECSRPGGIGILNRRRERCVSPHHIHPKVPPCICRASSWQDAAPVSGQAVRTRSVSRLGGDTCASLSRAAISVQSHMCNPAQSFRFCPEQKLHAQKSAQSAVCSPVQSFVRQKPA